MNVESSFIYVRFERKKDGGNVLGIDARRKGPAKSGMRRRHFNRVHWFNLRPRSYAPESIEFRRYEIGKESHQFNQACLEIGISRRLDFPQ
jgi:hypothetical protein